MAESDATDLGVVEALVRKANEQEWHLCGFLEWPPLRVGGTIESYIFWKTLRRYAEQIS